MYNASPVKLRSGAWGARVASTSVRRGDSIRITTRSGKSWTATVAKVVWSGSGVAICATEDEASNDTYTPRRGRSGAGSAASVPGYSSYCTDRPGCGCYDCAS